MVITVTLPLLMRMSTRKVPLGRKCQAIPPWAPFWLPERSWVLAALCQERAIRYRLGSMVPVAQRWWTTALVVLFLVRTIWVPAHLAVEPHGHPLSGAGSVAHDHRVEHRHSPEQGAHTHLVRNDAEGQQPDDQRRPEPEDPHPVVDHWLETVAPSARTFVSPDPVCEQTVVAAVVEQGLRGGVVAAVGSPPAGRSPPPRPPVRGPPIVRAWLI